MLKRNFRKIAVLTLVSLSASFAFAGEEQPLVFGKKKQPGAVKTIKPKKTTKKKYQEPKRIDLQLKDNDNPNVAWDNYFKKNKDVPSQDVRETVRVLMMKKKYDEVSAVIQSALRNGQPQIWMYQALATSLFAANRPTAEIERALMSAVDFTGKNPRHLMQLAKSIASFGFENRAIALYQRVGKMQPNNPLPYMRAMQLAKANKDIRAIKWSTLGILSKGWPKEHRVIEEEALLLANQTVDNLRKSGKKREAKAFQNQIKLAKFRDLVIRVTWTGNADVDMLVEEPTGTVCSFRNPRTTAGGVMLGDSFAHVSSDSPDGFSETYVCPKGFNGKYRVRLRKVWGKVTGGKVKVAVISRSFSDKDFGREDTKICDLKEGDTVVEVNFKNGRRKESLTQLQVQNIANNQIAIGQQILAQQLAALNNPATTAALANARVGNNNLNGNNTGFPGFFPRQGAVGFRPIITTLPEGANMAATAVMSADRRYVRITVIPIFSQIGKVLTFNIITGEIGNGDPDLDDGMVP